MLIQNQLDRSQSKKISASITVMLPHEINNKPAG